MKITRRPDPEKLHVIAATLRVWLVDVCVWLCRFWPGGPPRALRIVLRREIADALRDARMLVFLLAISRMHIPVCAPRTERPLSGPRGFRRGRLCSAGRAFGRGVRLRTVSIIARLRELRGVFTDLGHAVRRMLKHLHRAPRGIAFVPASAIVDRLCDLLMRAPSGVDTS